MLENSRFYKNQENFVVRVLLVDDHPLIRAGIRNFIDQDQKIEVVGESDNGQSAIPLIQKLNPDVVLVDVEMPIMGGVDLTIWLRHNYPRTKVIILSSYDDEPYILASLNAGANGYLLKNSSPQLIIHTLKEVVADNASFCPGITKKIVHLATKPQLPEHASEQLPSKRELEILCLVAKGYTNNEIGDQLHISSRTVQGHLCKLFRKLNVKTRTEAVTKASSLKLVDLENLDEN